MSEVSPTQSVFEHVLARPATTAEGEHEAFVHLWWSSPQQGERLVQVYVDGQLYDVSQETSQREMWLTLDRSQQHQIELLAVAADDADGLWRSHADLLTGWSPTVHPVASLSVVRDERLPVDTDVTVMVNGEAMDRGPLWPTTAHRGGFGALFGVGGFGYDALTGPGLGEGQLGMGPLGSDGTAWRWQRSDLAAGDYSITVRACDDSGQSVVESEVELTVSTDRLAWGATSVSITEDFTLQWSA